VKRQDEIIEQIERAFGANPYPGDNFIQGSYEGCEPYEEIQAFAGKTDWRKLDSKLLDGHYSALSFFSEAGFRFFLPSYLIADLREQLRTADPLFHLAHGFSPISVAGLAPSSDIVRGTGATKLLNPKRYGAMTWADHARFRLSVFTREEAQGIVSYLYYKRERDPLGINRSQIDAALEKFWLGRAEHAPTAEHLRAHLREEAESLAELVQRPEKPKT
jgi:hypothetical protein